MTERYPLLKLSLLLMAAACAHPLSAQSTAAALYSRVVVPDVQSVQERAATAMLIEEAARRTSNGAAARLEDTPLTTSAPREDAVVLATQREVPALLPASLLPQWRSALAALRPSELPESFVVVSLRWHSHTVTVLAGADQRGELFAAGWLLRHMRFAGPAPTIPVGLRLYSAPEKPVRGQQIGYRAKNNTYDAWTLDRFEQHIRELAIFGNNTIQLISPKSDDAAASPLFPAPALQTIVGISAILEKYGLDCDLYYPEMRDDYSNPATITAELQEFEALIKAMPRIDSLHVPGGDPGHTPPVALFPLVEREAAILHRYHPKATIWISGQGFDKANFTSFYNLLDSRPAWLTGVFFGPQSRDGLPIERQRIPAQLPIQFYPDIAHTMHAQFPVPEWDPIFALTEGREPICPRPQAFAAIYRRFQSLNTGFITYSEGVNDHVNQIVWDELGWSSKTSIDTILSEYAAFFLHREGEQNARAVRAIHGLEADWTGPLISNPQIPQTLQNFRQLEEQATPQQTAHNGQWESLLYRASYDAYLQQKLRRERSAETDAIAALSKGGDSLQRAAAANDALSSTRPGPEESTLHDRILTLAHQLFDDYGIQLSVPLYGASNWERGANLDRLDTPLNDAAWLRHAIAEALAQPDEPSHLAALRAIAHWQHPSPGVLYDDLGDPANEPHLLRGAGSQSDPELYHSAIDGIADRTLATNPSPAILSDSLPKAAIQSPWRLSFLTYAETLYEQPLQLRYVHLDPHRSWRVRVTYSGEDYALPLRLIANDRFEVHPARLRKSNPEIVEYPIPSAALVKGQLTLRWTGPEDKGGSGRGRQVAEVWLIPSSVHTSTRLSNQR